MRALLSLLAPPLCIACGADAGRATPICAACRVAMQGGGFFAVGSGVRCWAAFSYDGPAGAVVRALKFGGRARLADVMAAQIAPNTPVELLDAGIVPVPVHRDHRRRRGIDHVQVLATALGQRTDLDVADCLERTGDPRPQVGRGRQERVRGPLGSVALRPGAEPPPAALIVDDVVTTGATLAACVRALRESGCQRLNAIVYARTTAR